MNEQILIGILTEMKEMKADIKDMKTEMKDMKSDMREMKADMKDMKGRITNLENDMTEVKERIKSLEKSRKEDVRTITYILYSFEQGIVKIVNEEIDKRMYMQNIVK